MALSGIQIYKLLPQTNCKECGFPTCLAFAMKLAAKQVELSSCPYVSEASKAQLAESAAPPIRLVSLKSDGHEVKAGNEVVLFRHDKTFYNMPGIFIEIPDSLTPTEIQAFAKTVTDYTANYVGIDLKLDGFALKATSADSAKYTAALQALRQASKLPVILMCSDPAVAAAALNTLSSETPLLYAATSENWQAMAELAKQHKTALAVSAPNLDEFVDIVEKIKALGVEDIVLEPAVPGLGGTLTQATILRRLAIKKNFRSLGFPILAFPKNPAAAAQAIAKYAGFIVLDHFAPEYAYPLLILRQNVYTDPQKPIQVQPGIYEINSPKPTDPVLVTTNFSITYFSVANEIEGSGLPAWLLVTDAEGMSVLTAWAAGKFDAERIAKAVKSFNLAEKVSQKRIVLPGHVAVLSGELESELPDWEVKVGPREAVDIPAYMKQVL
jgi:acetyl-CoA decarbonylase/synthase, CODH/ACS complex subunit gamma